jgi:hypothetical protein
MLTGRVGEGNSGGNETTVRYNIVWKTIGYGTSFAGHF